MILIIRRKVKIWLTKENICFQLSHFAQGEVLSQLNLNSLGNTGMRGDTSESFKCVTVINKGNLNIKPTLKTCACYNTQQWKFIAYT